MTYAVRKRVVFTLASLLLTVIGIAYYTQELRYALPTPRPQGLVQPPIGATLKELLPDHTASEVRPLMLHFYNPDCPCSRFNESHLFALTQTFQGKADFVLVVPPNTSKTAKQRLQSLGCPIVEDNSQQIASRCGVYSTPQAVILDRTGTLVFRGNYNRTRYCAEPRSEYARLALEALVVGKPPPILPKQATIAYGCSLPAVPK